MTDKNRLVSKQNARVALRLPSKMREEIDALISKGKFKTLSMVMRAALAEFFLKGD